MFISGVHFATDMLKLVEELSNAMSVFAEGVEKFSKATNNSITLLSNLTCEADNHTKWELGEEFYK